LIFGLVNPGQNGDGKARGIDIVCDGCIQKYACRRCCSVKKSKQIVSQIINQLGNDRIGIVAYAALFRCCPSLLITQAKNVSAKHEH
jgi:Ca-activated chloride channel family protein